MAVNCSVHAYNLRKPLNLHLIISCNISLYRDTQVAIFDTYQIVYRYISNVTSLYTRNFTYYASIMLTVILLYFLPMQEFLLYPLVCLNNLHHDNIPCKVVTTVLIYTLLVWLWLLSLFNSFIKYYKLLLVIYNHNAFSSQFMVVIISLAHKHMRLFGIEYGIQLHTSTTTQTNTTTNLRYILLMFLFF